MPALLESVPRGVAEPLIARVKAQAARFLQSMGIGKTTPQFEEVLDRTVSQGCRRGVAGIRKQGRPIGPQDADSIYRNQFEASLRDVFSMFEQSFSGVALNVSSMGAHTWVDLSVTVLVREENGSERLVPAFLFVCEPFVDGDRFEKAPAELAARRAIWLCSDTVDNDWQFLWSRFGDRTFCEQYWNQYVAVFMREVVGSGSTDPAARDVAIQTLGQRGASGIPPERFVVDFVGDA